MPSIHKFAEIPARAIAAVLLAVASVIAVAVPGSLAAPDAGAAEVSVTVTVDWGVVSADTSQTFEVCLTGPSYPNGDEAGACLTVGSSGGELSWSSLTPGDYTVESTAQDDWYSTYAGPPGSTGSTPVVVTAVVDETVAAAVTVANRGILTFRKVVQGDGDLTNPGQTFIIAVTNRTRSFGSGQVVPGAGPQGRTDLEAGTWTFKENNIPANWDLIDISCTARHPATSSIGTFDPETNSIDVVLAVGDRIDCVFTNEFTPPGTLEVDVDVDWGVATVVPSTTFEVCTAGPSFPVGDETGACQTTGPNSGTLIWTDLLPGDYTVTSTPSTSDWYTTYSGPGGSTGTTPVVVTMPENGSTNATVTEQNRGVLSFRKVVQGDGDPGNPEQTFDIRVTNGSRAFGSRAVVPGAGPLGREDVEPGTWTYRENNIPAHWTLIDISCNPRSDTSSVGTFDPESNSIDVVLAVGDRIDCVFTNVYTPPGTLVVPVTVDWNGVAPDTAQQFEVCISGPSYPTGLESGACQNAGYAGENLTWDDLIPGDYVPVETDPGSVWQVTGSGGTFAVSSALSTDATAIANVHSAATTVTFTPIVPTGWGDPSAPDQSFQAYITTPAGTFGGGSIAGYTQTVGSGFSEGEYGLSAAPVPLGWTLLNLACTSTAGTSTAGTFTAGSTSLPLTLAAGDVVDCEGTYVFATAGTLDVTVEVKDVNIAADLTTQFEVCLTGPSFPTGAETGACQAVGILGGVLHWENLMPGDYTADETDPGSLWSVVGSGQTAAVAIGTLPELTITNTHAPLRIIPASPSSLISAGTSTVVAQCGAASVTLSNDVGQIPAGAIAEVAQFTVMVDGAPKGFAIQPNDSMTLDFAFPEDSGDHEVIVVGMGSKTVSSDCIAAPETPDSGVLAVTGTSGVEGAIGAGAVLALAGLGLLGLGARRRDEGGRAR